VNEIICHGIPDDRKLVEGDIINLDISLFFKGMHADLNETYCVGETDKDSKYLVKQYFHLVNSQDRANLSMFGKCD